MEDRVIPEGYILTIYTWENDADNPKTQTREGLTEDELRCYLTICYKFRSHSYDRTNFGNLDTTEFEAVEDFIKSTCEKYGVEYHEDLQWELIGTWNYGDFYRVFDYAEVAYNWSEVTFESRDPDDFVETEH